MTRKLYCISPFLVGRLLRLSRSRCRWSSKAGEESPTSASARRSFFPDQKRRSFRRNIFSETLGLQAAVSQAEEEHKWNDIIGERKRRKKKKTKKDAKKETMFAALPVLQGRFWPSCARPFWSTRDFLAKGNHLAVLLSLLHSTLVVRRSIRDCGLSTLGF